MRMLTPLAKVLEEQGRKGNWVARQLVVDASAVSRWKMGTEPIPADRLTQLAALLDVSEELLVPSNGRPE